MRSAEIQVSDTHVGHKTGIMFPDPYIDHKPNKAQKWLYKTFSVNFQFAIEEFLDKWKPDYVHISLLGDMGDIDYKNRSKQFWTSERTMIAHNAGQLLDPLVQMADSLHLVRGTKAHIGEDGGVDELIAKEFDITVPPDGYQQFSHWFVDFELSNVLINIAHHGRNRTKWTDDNGLNSLKNEIILSRAKNNERIPKIISRGHFHFSGHTPWDDFPYVIAVPSWQLPTDFIYRIDPKTEIPMVGGNAIMLEDGKIIDVLRKRYRYPRSKVWRPKNKINEVRQPKTKSK